MPGGEQERIIFATQGLETETSLRLIAEPRRPDFDDGFDLAAVQN